MNIAYNTTTTLSCQQNSSIPPFPVWYINNSEIPAISDYTTKIDPSTGDLIGILVIDGNETSGTLKLRCAMGGQTTFTTNITIKGLHLYMATDLDSYACIACYCLMLAFMGVLVFGLHAVWSIYRSLIKS